MECKGCILLQQRIPSTIVVRNASYPDSSRRTLQAATPIILFSSQICPLSFHPSVALPRHGEREKKNALSESFCDGDVRRHSAMGKPAKFGEIITASLQWESDGHGENMVFHGQLLVQWKQGKHSMGVICRTNFLWWVMSDARLIVGPCKTCKIRFDLLRFSGSRSNKSSLVSVWPKCGWSFIFE